jgi:hypothetical protein
MIGICQVYACHISSAGHFLFNWPLPGISGLLSAPDRFRPGLSANTFGLGDRLGSANHSRLGPAKVPQPGVDLINMAVPASA